MGIPGSPSPLLMRRAAAAGEEAAYQIKHALRLEATDTAYLHKYQKTNDATNNAAGDRRTWTFSIWFKLTGNTPHNSMWLFCVGDGGSRGGVFINNDFQVCMDGGGAVLRKSNGRLRDFSAWYNLVTVLDTSNAVTEDRLRFYLNGEKITSWATNSTVSQHWNGLQFGDRWEPFYIGKDSEANTTNYFDGYIADPIFIGGLALSPGSFGKFSASRTWDPKAFALSAPNKGTTWSSSVTTEAGSFHSNGPAANLFDGLITTQVFDANAGGWEKFSPSGGISYNHGVEVYRGNTVNTTTSNSAGTWTITDDDGTVITKEFGNATGVWDTLVEGSGKFTEIKADPESGQWNYWGGIKVDGVILVDGVTDPTTRNNLNDGRVWSALGTASGTAYNSGYDHTKVFDGNPATQFFAATGPNSAGFTFDTSISNYDKLEMLISGPHNNLTTGFKLNGVDKTSAVIDVHGNGGVSWVDIGASDFLNGAALSSFEIYSTAGNTYVGVEGIKVNGHSLIDGTWDNSFHLDFADNSTSRNLGKNKLRGKITGSTGGLPIYNTKASTNDAADYGDAKDTGYRSDSNAAGLKLAIPGDVLTDEHDHVTNATGSAVTVTANGGIAVSTAQSRFYGSSIRFNGLDNDLTISSPPFTISDRSTTYTIEGWFWADNSVFSDNTYRSIFQAGDFNMGFWRSAHSGSGKKIYVEGDGSGSTWGATCFSKTRISPEVWYHIAFVRNGTSLKLFLDGSLQSEVTSSGTDSAESAWIMGAAASSRWKGYQSDFKVYDTAIYSSDFKPPVRDSFDVSNINVSPGFPNDGRTWSSTLTYSSGGASSSHPATKGFDGSLASGDRIESADSGAVITIPIAGTIEKDGIQVYVAVTSSQPVIVRLYDGDLEVQGMSSGASGLQWHTFSGSWSGSSAAKVTKITVERTNRAAEWNAIKINGEILIDGQSDSASIDLVTDTPTNYAPTDDGDTGVGGEVRGTYAVLNKLSMTTSSVLSHGDLEHRVSNNNWGAVTATMGMSSGKYYWEIECKDTGDHQHGIVSYSGQTVDGGASNIPIGNYSWAWAWEGNNGTTRHNNSQTSYGATYGDGDVIGVQFDADAGNLYFWKNGTIQNSGTAAYTGLTDGPYLPCVCSYGASGNTKGSNVNFGQRPFKYQTTSGGSQNRPSSDYKCLCTTNLADTFGANDNSAGDLNNPAKYFDICTYTGNGGTQTITEFAFQPDVWWEKTRSMTNSHHLVDAIRGGGEVLLVDAAVSNYTSPSFGLTFTSNGVTFTEIGSYTANSTNQPYVGMAWDAGTAEATASTDGSVTPTAQWVNATAGFSLSEVEKSSGAQTYGHGLGKEPHFMIIKNYDTTDAWIVYNKVRGSKYFFLHNELAEFSDTPSAFGNNDDDVFELVNGLFNSGTHVCYTWTAIPGYSAFGSYHGNVNADGPWCYCGFQPRLIMARSVSGSRDWLMWDTERGTTNGALRPNVSNGELTGNATSIDIVSNGFKIKTTYTNMNANEEHVWAAWAEHPQKTARGRMIIP